MASPVRRFTRRDLPRWMGFLILAGGGVLLFWFMSFRQSPPAVPGSLPKPGSSAAATSTPTAEQLAAEAAYRQAVQTLLGPSGIPADAATAQAAVLALTVPGRYRTVHLDVVLALESLRLAQASGDSAQQQAALAQLAAVGDLHPWIRPTPSPATANP